MATHKESKSFRAICEEFNLRYKLNDAGEPVSPTRKRVSPEDHLYDLRDGAVGVHISRETKKKYTFSKNKLVRMGCSVIQDGDMEGNFSVSKECLLEVAKELSCVKKNRTFTDEEKQAIRERLKK
tara:strand:- start:4253 stop:4627 length:375 start_codon:yes stop_codon:yes gene_type:complete